MQSLLVLVALAACVFAENQDQETAEQYFRSYGYYPSWYSGHHFAAPAAYPYGFVATEKKAEEKKTDETPVEKKTVDYKYYYPQGYGYTGQVAPVAGYKAYTPVAAAYPAHPYSYGAYPYAHYTY